MAYWQAINSRGIVRITRTHPGFVHLSRETLHIGRRIGRLDLSLQGCWARDSDTEPRSTTLIKIPEAVSSYVLRKLKNITKTMSAMND